MFLVCHILTTPIDKQGLDTFKQNMLERGVKSQISNSDRTLMCEVRRFWICNMKFSKNSPKLHFGVTKKDPGLLFHFHVSNLFKCWSNLGLTEFKIIIKYSKNIKK